MRSREKAQKQLSTERLICPNSAALTLPAGFSDQNKREQQDPLPIDLSSLILSKTKWLYKVSMILENMMGGITKSNKF